MSATTYTLLQEAKSLIDHDAGLEQVKEYVGDALLLQEPIDWVYLFQKVYIHACLRKRTDVATWLQEVCFPQLDAIQQIAVRQVFAYGRHLLKNRKAA